MQDAIFEHRHTILWIALATSVLLGRLLRETRAFHKFIGNTTDGYARGKQVWIIALRFSAILYPLMFLVNSFLKALMYREGWMASWFFH